MLRNRLAHRLVVAGDCGIAEDDPSSANKGCSDDNSAHHEAQTAHVAEVLHRVRWNRAAFLARDPERCCGHLAKDVSLEKQRETDRHREGSKHPRPGLLHCLPPPTRNQDAPVSTPTSRTYDGTLAIAKADSTPMTIACFPESRSAVNASTITAATHVTKAIPNA